MKSHELVIFAGKIPFKSPIFPSPRRNCPVAGSRPAAQVLALGNLTSNDAKQLSNKLVTARGGQNGEVGGGRIVACTGRFTMFYLAKKWDFGRKI